MTAPTPPQTKASPAVERHDQLDTRRESMLTQALTGAKSGAQAQSHAAQYFEGRHAAAEARAGEAERVAAERAIALVRAETQLASIRQLNLPCILLQAGSGILAVIGGWQLGLPGRSGFILVAAAAGCHIVASWVQKRIIPPKA